MIRSYTEKVLVDLGDFGQDLERIAEEMNSQFPY